MSAAREKDQADFDLEAFIDLFDEALTSDDPSVQKTLPHLMVIAALARNHNKHDRRNGPLRRLFDDQAHILRRLESLEIGNTRFGGTPVPGTYGPGTAGWPSPVVTQPYNPASPGTGSWPPRPGTYPPGTIWAQTSGTAASVTIPDSGAYSTSATLDPAFGAIPTLNDIVPNKTNKVIAERVSDLLQSGYKGSTVGKM